MPAGTRDIAYSAAPRLLALAAAVCTLCTFGMACAITPLGRKNPCWRDDTCEAPPLSPDANPTQLPFGATLEGGLHCDEGDCQDWYRVGVSEEGPIEIELRALEGSEPGRISLVLLDQEGTALVQPKQPSQRIEYRLAAGSYQLGVVTVGTRGQPLRYEVLAERRDSNAATENGASGTSASKMSGSAAAPHARESGEAQPGWIRSDVIEVEADSSSVLIEAGKTQGLSRGQRGELVQAGQTIARIELVEVYESGSRARLLAPVTHAIDPLEAEVRIPVVPASRAH
jgi:hypothetical protein